MTEPAAAHSDGQFYCPHCERMYVSGETCPSDGTRLVKLKAVIDPLIGRNLDGRYKIIERLGQGGMGAVYRGSQVSVDREVAIKVVGAQIVSHPDAVKRFLREARLASRLSHPNAVAVLDFGQTDDGLFYLVMELVVGRTLDRVLEEEHAFSPQRLIAVGAQICDALEDAHALQIVHRDLKPANVMLLARGGRDVVKVLDFGLAKSLAGDQPSMTMTNAGSLMGTPAFMSPEQALGRPCDARADLYSLGCVLYLLGSGRLPFESESVQELVMMQAHEPAPPMTGVPASLAAVIERLLQKDPDQRYQSAAETRAALERAHGRALTPLPIEAVDSSPSIQTGAINPARARSASDVRAIIQSNTLAAPPVTQRRSRGRMIVLGVLGVLAIGGGAFIASKQSNDEPRTPSAPAAATEVAPVPQVPQAPPVQTPAVVPDAAVQAEPVEQIAAEKPAKPARPTSSKKKKTAKRKSEAPPTEEPAQESTPEKKPALPF